MATIFFWDDVLQTFLCCTGILKLHGLRFLYASPFDLQKILAQHFAATRLKSRNSWAPSSSQEHRWPRPSALSACSTVHNTAPLAPLCLSSFVFASQSVFSMCLLLRALLGVVSPVPVPAPERRTWGRPLCGFVIQTISSWCRDDVTMALFHKYLLGVTTGQ